MVFKLADIKDWNAGLSCSPTALAAITGKTPTEIGGLLKDTAKINGPERRNEIAKLRSEIQEMNRTVCVLRLCDLGGPGRCGQVAPFLPRLSSEAWRLLAPASRRCAPETDAPQSRRHPKTVVDKLNLRIGVEGLTAHRKD
jgi:hypothetical protein